MAKQNLPVNYKDDVMSSSMGAKRRWQITQNTDGTYNIEDVTTYDQVGSEFGAGDINATNKAVNQSADAGKIIDDPDTAEATTKEGYIAGVQLFNHVNDSLGGLQFGIDENGNYGYIKAGADSVTPFSSFNNMIYAVPTTANQATKVATITIPDGVTRGLLVGIGSGMASAQSADAPKISSTSTGVLNYETIAITDKLHGNVGNIPIFISAYMVNVIPNKTIEVTANGDANSSGICALFLY